MKGVRVILFMAGTIVLAQEISILSGKPIPPYYQAFVERAQKGDPVALYELNEEAMGTNSLMEFLDHKAVKRKWEQLLKQGNPTAMAFWGNWKLSYLDRNEVREGRQWLEQSVAKGDPYGMLFLADALTVDWRGDFPKDPKRAEDLSYHAYLIFQGRAQKGDTQAMFEMAKRGFSGRRITIEMDKARWTWCRKAADAGHARAAELYAGMAPVMEGISHKKGMERKCIELIDQWMLQAADLGSWRAMKTLGKQHYFGSKYTKRDQKKGIAYFQKLIEVLGCDEPIRSIEDEMEVKILSPDGRVLPAPRPKRWKG